MDKFSGSFIKRCSLSHNASNDSPRFLLCNRFQTFHNVTVFNIVDFANVSWRNDSVTLCNVTVVS